MRDDVSHSQTIGCACGLFRVQLTVHLKGAIHRVKATLSITSLGVGVYPMFLFDVSLDNHT